jgi:hypothetical protein
MTVYTTATEIAAEIEARVGQIRTANGFATDIGATVFRGRIAVNDEDVPCVSIIEGTDSVLSTPGRAALWKIEQHYALVGYVPCDPANPNDAAHALITDLKRAIFKTNGKADATFGGKVLEIHYKGRNIGPRADGAPIVMGIVEIAVVFAESLS